MQQTFTATAGDTLSGSSFFKTGDYLPYDDTGDVRMVVTASGSETILFSSSVSAVGNFGGTPWRDWSFTFPSTSTYTLSARADNVQDCGVASVVGIDIPVPVDTDGDGLVDAGDNCPAAANADQANNDGDSQGDACDTNDDNDTVLDANDNCQFVANDDQANNDGDSQGDACDADDDNDTVADTADNCAMTANDDQANNDGDSQGDVCDADDDNDGDNDIADNCPMSANSDQRDSDGDGAGDACDGVFNSTDGKTSGGGFLNQPSGKVNFSVSGKSDAGKLVGTCVVTAGSTKIKCLDVTGFYKSATNDRIVMVGNATINGTATTYRIELTDNGEPGTSDRIEIEAGAFAAAGTIGGGNLQVHK